MLDMFLELCAIPSAAGQERRITDRLLAELDAIGLAHVEDGTGASYDAEAGNVLVRLPATIEGGTPIFLCAHLDTVAVEGAIEPVVEDGIVRSAGETILGADNKSAVVVLLEVARRIVAEGIQHAGLELLFTQREETGLLGAEAFDLSRLVARLGYVYDQAAPVGEVIMGAPTAYSIEARFHGRAAHAGMHAEDGRSAILAAARAIADLRLGQLDACTTANVGVIEGGTARNVVPEWCTVRAEARSRDEHTLTALVQEMVDALAFAAATSDCTVETKVVRMYQGYELGGADPVVRLAEDGLRRAGVEPWRAFSGGGADGNVFNAKGLPCANLANGMVDIHTHDERIAVADLERMVDVSFGILAVARETPA
jgi:tripeptide aminopeptidase